MADYTDAEFSDLLDQLAQLPVEDRASDLLKLLKTLLTKNVTVQDWNTLIRDIAPLYATMLGLNDCMVNLINKVQRELGIVTGSSDSALSRIIALEDETLSLANDKFDKTGGTIDGPVIITKGLTVRGTNTAVTTEHLRVEDAVIEANVGATAESIPLLSGYVIHIGDGKAYGMVYDKVAESVKLGLVKKDAEGNYRFESGEGQSVALRADTKALTPGHLVVWNGNKNRLETKFKVWQDPERMTVVQRTTNGEVLTADPTTDNAAVPKHLLDKAKTEIDAELSKRLKVHENTSDNQIPLYPVIPKLVRNVSNDPTQGFYQAWEQLTVEAIKNAIPKRTSYGAVQTLNPRVPTDSVNLQYANEHYVALNTVIPKSIYAVDSNKKPVNLPFTMEPTANTMAQRGANGVLKVGNPAAPKDAVNLEYLAAQLSAVTGASPYFVHNICITQTVDNVVNTVRVSLVCTQVAKITSVAALRTLIVQLNGGEVSAAGSVPVWHGACNMAPYNPSEGVPDSMLVYSGYIGLWNDTTLKAWGDTIYPSAAHNVTLDDTNWTVSDKILNTVVGGTTA